MKEHEKTLYQDIERCVELLQEAADLEATKAVSVFSERTLSNEQWLQNLKKKIELREDDELEQLRSLKNEHINKIDAVESKIEYYEKLLDEIEEFQNELEVKTKLAQKRRTRMNSGVRE